MANELRRCPNPWCNGFAEVEPHSFLPKTWFVICQDCELDGPQQNTPEKAIAAWNARPPSPAFVAMREALEEARDHLYTLQDCARIRELAKAALINGNLGPSLITFRVVQDGTGGCTVIWPANVRNGGEINSAPAAFVLEIHQIDAALTLAEKEVSE